MRFSKLTLLPLVLSAFMTLTAGAQQKDCSIDENKFAKDVFNLQRARSAKTPDDAAKALKATVEDLTSNTDNPVERNYVLGQALALWIAQPSTPDVAKRGDLGYKTNPEGTVDLAAAVDSAFTAVETARPECAAQISGPNGIRRNEGWVKVANAAVQAINADKVDTAEALAKRSLLLYKSPIGYNILANVAQKRGNTRDAIDAYNRFIASAQGDTSLTDNRRQALLLVGNLATDAAQNAPAADKAKYVADAKQAYQTLAAEGDQHYADLGKQGLARIALVSGDTAALKAAYQPQLANPSQFNYNQLMSGAVAASQTGDIASATKLFKAAYQLNPYHRDVLSNLSIMYVKQDSGDAALPYVKQLVSIDPSHAENYRLYAYAYAAMQKRLMAENRAYGTRANATHNARLKRALIDSARISNDSIRTVTDLALKYNNMADSLPVNVTFTEFTPSDTGATLGGAITNNSGQQQTYSFKVDFLDKSGNVLSSQQASVGPVAPHAQGTFNVSGKGAGIVAFKYAPLQ